MSTETENKTEQANGNSSERDSNRQTSINNLPFKPLFKRRKVCPFSGPKGLKIDYRDVRMLQRYVSERGRIIPSRITGVSAKKQRELANAIKRARFMALMPYVAD